MVKMSPKSKFPCSFLTFVIDKVCLTTEDWQIVKEDLSRVVIFLSLAKLQTASKYIQTIYVVAEQYAI